MQKNHLAAAIERELLNLADPADQKLTENELVDKFGVSRTPIREALNFLELRGLIERRKNRGISLRRPELREVAEIYDLRAVLEGFAGRLIAETATEKDLDRLARLADQLDAAEAAGDRTALRAADRGFHELIVNLSAHQLLGKVMADFAVIERAFLMYHKSARRYSAGETPYGHQLIVQALRQRDAAESERLLRGHSQWAKERLLEQALEIKLRPLAE